MTDRKATPKTRTNNFWSQSRTINLTIERELVSEFRPQAD